MKRNLSDAEDEEDPKRSKLQLTFYASGIKFVKGLCSRDAFHAAKQLVSEQGVQLEAVVEGTTSPCVWVQGRVTLNANAASFPHTGLRQASAADVDAAAAAAGQVETVQLCLHGSTGELLDAHSSCCAGGFQPVLGSFCPCIAALLLRAAQHMAVPEQAVLSPLAGLPSWAGSSVQDVLAAQSQLHSALCLVPQPSCYTTGLGLQPWQYEDRVSSSNRVHFASQRQVGGMYYASSSRPASDPDKLASMEDASDDLASDPWFTNSSLAALAATPGLLQELQDITISDAEQAAKRLLARTGAAASATAGGAAGVVASDAAAQGAEQRQRKLLALAVGNWLAVYGGKQIQGHGSRPKVVNVAFELLLGGVSGAAGRPLCSLVLLLRALWDYLHCHGLGRLLAKPLKAMHALRNTLLVSAVPLWMRRAVAAQLDSWERSLLWQHAATPLEVTGAVGLVHLLRAIQEVRQLCLHHWDEPQLAALLTGPVAEQQRQQQQVSAQPKSAVSRFSSGSSHGAATAGSSAAAAAAGAVHRANSSSGGGPAGHAALRLWQPELPSLLGLRLLMLGAVGQYPAYLELAMAGGAWKKAIDCMLHSKERSQLLKAVQLLPRHIASLSERMGYMRKLLGLESLGAPERLELVARLLLDVRDALAGQRAKLHIPPSRASIAARYRPGGEAGSSGYPFHVWEATLYSLQEEGEQRGDRGMLEQQRRASNSALWNEWSDVMREFILTAAQALFEVGRASVKTHRQHLLDISDSAEPDSNDEAAAEQLPANVAGPSNAPGAQVQREQHPAVVQPCMIVDAMLLAPHAARPRQAPVMRYCPDCQGMHMETEPASPPVAAPKPGDADWQLLDVNPEVFNGCSSTGSAMGYPEEARGQLKARGKTGYIQDPAVLAAYRKVQRVQYPELLPLCSLDALCIATLSAASMAHFDSGGLLDTSLDLGPLRELLGHGLVEMGPAAVRVQAALDAAVYTSVMSPPSLPFEQSDDMYRSLTYQLLGSGQRSLALLAARTRFKLCPGPQSAGELLEVAIAAGPAAEAAAVDLVLGKGLVRQPDADDEALLRGPGGEGGGGGGGGGSPRSRPRHLQRALEANPARHQAEILMQVMLRGDMLEEEFRDIYDDIYADDPYPGQRLVHPVDALYDEQLHEEGLRARQQMLRRRAEAAAAFGARDGGDDGRWSSDSDSFVSVDERGEGGEGEQGRPLVIMDDDNDSADGPQQLQQQPAAGDQSAAAAAAPAAAAAGGPVNAEALAARRLEALHQLLVQQQMDAEAAAGGGAAAGSDTEMDEQQQPHEEESLDTRQLLGEAAAAAIQLKDTASSALQQPPAPVAAANPPGYLAGGADEDARVERERRDRLVQDAALRAALAERFGLGPREVDLMGRDPDDDEFDSDDDDDDMEMEELMGGPYGRYGMHRPLRDLPPAEIKPRPKPAAAGGSSSRPRPAAAAAAGGGGGGGGGDDGPGSGDASARARKRSSAGGGRRRRSASAELLADSQQAALVADLFGISASSSSHPSTCLRIHLRRLSGLQLWTVARYAAGRGAAPDSVRRLGLAAWLSDNTTSSTVASMPYQARAADCLQWVPTSDSQEGWLAAAQRTRERTSTVLLASSEPYDGLQGYQHSWSGLPSANWASFVAQERLPQRWEGGPQHHSTPDANLAWLLAVSGSSEEASTDASSSSDAKERRAVSACTRSAIERMTVQTAYGPATEFIPSAEFTGARPGYVFKRGSGGMGYYTDLPLSAAMAISAAAATAAPREPVELDLSSCKELLQQLAALSRSNRYGLPMLQLCHALLTAGDRSTCLSLLPQALLPAGFGLQGLTPNSCLVAALQELLPVAAKHGDVPLRVSAAVTSVLITRRPLPVSVLGDPDVLAGVVSWWCGLVGALHEKPEEWRAEASFAALPTLLASINQQYWQHSVSNNWAALQRLLVRCVLPSLGAQQASQQHLGIVPGGGLKDLGGAPLPAQQGYAMLLACPAVSKAPWPLQLYFCRLCWVLQLTPDLPALAQLLCPALLSAVQLHIASLPEAAPADMTAWKAQRHARALTTQSSIRALDWVAAVLSWLASELTMPGAGSSSSSSASSSRCQLGQAELTQFIDSLCAALHGWHGPELLPLAVALQQLQAAQQQPAHQRKPHPVVSQPVLRLLRSGLLPAVGRADEVAGSSCVRSGGYKAALCSLMRDEALLQALPQDMARSLALTYWYQEATPAALLTANDMLLKLEGAGSAQALQLPQGTGLTAALATRASSSAAAAAVVACKLGVGAGSAALPQVHSVLLQHLDLVPSGGGLEAAGLRFMQLQVHASNGQYEAALQSCFSAAPDNGASHMHSPAAGLSGQMEVADAVLRLVANNAATPSISGLIASPPYTALLGLAAPGACRQGGAGEGLLAGLSSAMQTHLLRLQIWRLARHIISRPPGISIRIANGPAFLAGRTYSSVVYNAGHMPPAPSWQDPQVVGKWTSRGLPALLGYICDQGLAELHVDSVGGASNAAHVLCNEFEAQEQSLLWCVLRYASLVAGMQVERDLGSLLSPEQRNQLGQLPVFVMGLGQQMKDPVPRLRLMWAYASFRSTLVTNSKVRRYIHRNAHDQASLQRYLVKFTVSELQALKAECLPWWAWDMGQKAQQGAELAEWLWWLTTTWRRTRSAAGLGVEPLL